MSDLGKQGAGQPRPPSAVRAAVESPARAASVNEAIEFIRGRYERFGRRSAAEAIMIGQLLIELKGFLEHGEFEAAATGRIGMSVRTARRWMSVASATMLSLGIEQRCRAAGLLVSSVLLAPAGQLKGVAAECGRVWAEFSSDLKLTLAALEALIGDETTGRRALNGKLLGGEGGARKDFAEFTLRKLRHLSTFFGSWEGMTERQRTEIKSEFAAAICGEEFKLRGRENEELTAPVTFRAWPVEVCEVALEAIRARLKAARQRGNGGEE